MDNIIKCRRCGKQYEYVDNVPSRIDVMMLRNSGSALRWDQFEFCPKCMDVVLNRIKDSVNEVAN